MSSDSEDDFSYSNTASVLKGLKKKTVHSSKINGGNNVNLDLTFNESHDRKLPRITRKNRTEPVSEEKTAVIEISEDSNESVIFKNKLSENSCVVVSDDEVEARPLDIISAIDNVLQRGRRGTKSKRGRYQTRQNKKLKLQAESENAIVFVSSSSKKSTEVEDAPEEDVNYEISVKVWWMSQYLKKFTLKRFEKMAVIFEYFSEKENIAEDQLLFTMQDKIVLKTDTPDRLNVNATTVIEGGVLSKKTNIVVTKEKSEGIIELKVQVKDRKQPLIIGMKATDKMKVLMCQCSEELKVPWKKLRFYFDGDLIQSDDTLNDLQLEDGDCIDCIK